MTYEQLKELVDTMLNKTTYDRNKCKDILNRVESYNGDRDKKLALLIDLLSSDIVFGDGINYPAIERTLSDTMPGSTEGILDILCFIARNATSIPAARNILEFYQTEIGFSHEEVETLQDAIDFYSRVSEYGCWPHDTFWTYEESIRFGFIMRYIEYYNEVLDRNDSYSTEKWALDKIYKSICEYYSDVNTVEEAKQYLLEHTDGYFHERVVESQKRLASDEGINVAKILKSSAPELLKWAMLKQYFMTNYPDFDTTQILVKMRPVLREQDFAQLVTLFTSDDLPKQLSEVDELVDEWLRRFPIALVQQMGKYDRLYLCYELTTRLEPFPID